MSNTLAQAHDHLPSSDRRRHSRHPIKTLAYVALDEGNGGIVLNISEGGFSVQAVTSLMDDLLPGVRFQLSESDGWVEANARITWTGESRKVAGLEFVDLPEDTRSRIREWLSRETLPTVEPADAGAPAEESAPTAARLIGDETTLPSADPAETTPSASVLGNELLEQDSQATAPIFEEAQPAAPIVRVPEVVRATPGASLTPMPDPVRETQALPTVQPVHAAPGLAAKLFHDNWALAALVAILAIGSLAAGWAAGEGAFGKFLQRAQQMAPQSIAPQLDALTHSIIPVARVNEIEVVNASNQRWTIPFDGPMNTPDGGARRPASGNYSQPAHKQPTGFRTWILTPPLQTRTASDGDTLKETPPPVPTATSGSENVLSPSGSLNSQGLAAPQVLRKPEPAVTGVVKEGHLLRRVDPVYPTLARNQLVEGEVRLNVTIDPDGTVRNVALLGGPRLLVAASEAAVRQWRYSPSTVDGRPIEFQQEVDLRFHLSEAAH
jgi:TonB family protein